MSRYLLIVILMISLAGILFAQEAEAPPTDNEDIVVDVSTEEGEAETAAPAAEAETADEAGEPTSVPEEEIELEIIDEEPIPEAEITEAETKPGKVMSTDDVLKYYSRNLFKTGRFEEALDVVEVMLEDRPEDANLLRFKGQIITALRDLNILRKYVDTDAALSQVLESSLTPKKPEAVERPKNPQVVELVSGMNREQRAVVRESLNQRISLNVLDAPLSYVLNLLFRGTGINIIADQSVLQGKKLTIQVEKIPLEGVLNYISRLEGITYSISHETVWITSSDKPMHETRIIRLRSGLTDVLEALSPETTQAQLPAGNQRGGGGAQGGASGPSAANSDLEKVLARIGEIIEWPTDSAWVLDKKTNSLFVRSTSDALDKFEKVVGAMDIPPLQVLIEAKFIEISDGDLSDVGIEWQFANTTRIRGMGDEGVSLETGSGTNFGFSNRPNGSVDFTSNVTGMDLFLTGVLSAPEFNAVLHAINTKDSSHTLSSPTLLTMNNFLGTIKVTTDLVYIESYTVDRSNKNNNTALTAPLTTNYSLGDDDGDGFANEDPYDGVDNDGDGSVDEDGLPWDTLNLGTSANLSSEPVIIPIFASDFEGVVLKVLPSIGLDGEVISMTLQPEVNEKVGEETFNLVIPEYTGTAEIKRPIMNRRTFVTKLSIKDGSTVVLGGLKRERDIKMVSRVPILGNIPILGRLFSRTYSNTVASNLLIFVTAHILEPSGSMYKSDNEPEKKVLVETPDGRALTKEEIRQMIKERKAP